MYIYPNGKANPRQFVLEVSNSSVRLKEIPVYFATGEPTWQ